MWFLVQCGRSKEMNLDDKELYGPIGTRRSERLKADGQGIHKWTVI